MKSIIVVQIPRSVPRFVNTLTCCCCTLSIFWESPCFGVSLVGHILRLQGLFDQSVIQWASGLREAKGCRPCRMLLDSASMQQVF